MAKVGRDHLLHVTWPFLRLQSTGGRQRRRGFLREKF